MAEIIEGNEIQTLTSMEVAEMVGKNIKKCFVIFVDIVSK